MEKLFDIPGFTYFSEKNIYTGSINNLFNYKITTGEKLSAVIWLGKFCLAKTPDDKIIANADFELTKEGLDELKNWLNQKYEENKEITLS
ncbi:MAG: hypothetical protein PUE12_12740 [Oscillospiraceae bacterium]|nr:hypothetical protein [Oscillospiraceae bacterium]